MGKVNLPQLGSVGDVDDSASRRKAKQHKEIFSHFNLTMDKTSAKYMPYSEVAFPKLADERKGNENAKMETMWMVGFLDQDKQAEKQLALSKLDHFINLPGGELLPSAMSAVRKIYDRDERKRKQKEAAERQKRGKNQEEEDPRGQVVSESSTMHAKLMEFRKKSYSNNKPIRKCRWKTPQYIYGNENKRIRKLLLGSSSTVKLQQQLRAQGIEELFEVKRMQTVATVCIQRAWKRYLRMCHWWEVIRQTTASIEIQRRVRGMLARILILRWHLRRSWFVVVAQASVRKFLAIKHTRLRTEFEHKMVTRMQRLVRAYLSRRRLFFLESMKAATQIQRMWRGGVARTVSDRLWLDREVTLIQALVRGHLARCQMDQYTKRVSNSCTHIQRVFRGMDSRKRRDNLLWEREMENRRILLKQLRSEDAFQVEQLAKVTRDSELHLMEEKLAKLRKAEDASIMDVRKREYDYLQLKLERSQVSPRAISQGWTEELDRNIKEHRKWVTGAKEKYLFKDARELRQTYKGWYDVKTELELLEYKLKQIRKYRNHELESLNARESEKRWRNKQTNMKRKIGQQKRRWKVKHFNKNGKPIKLKPKSSQEDTAVSSSELMQHLTGSKLVSVDTPMHLNDGHYGLIDTVPGTNDSVFNVLRDKVASQNTRNMLQQYSSLLKPIFQEMTMVQLDVQARGYPPRYGKFEDPDEKETVEEDGAKVEVHSNRKSFGSDIPWKMVDHLGRKKSKFQSKQRSGKQSQFRHDQIEKERERKAKRWIVGQT